MPSVDEHPGRPTAGIARVKNVVCFSCFHSCPFLWLWYWGTERERDVSLHNCQASGPSVILWANNWCNLWLCQQVDLLSHNWERLRTSGQFTAIQGSGALLSYCGVWACPNSNSSFCVVGALWCGIFFLFCWGFCLLEYIIFFHSTFFYLIFYFASSAMCGNWEKCDTTIIKTYIHVNPSLFTQFMNEGCFPWAVVSWKSFRYVAIFKDNFCRAESFPHVYLETIFMQTETCMEHSSGIQLVLLAGFLSDFSFLLRPFSEKVF